MDHNLYIQILNGEPINHPVFENNLIQAFTKIPPNWEPFSPTERPELGVYQLFHSNDFDYVKVDGVWTHTWNIIDMTQEQIDSKQNDVKKRWSSQDNYFNFTTWNFNEELCMYEPPIEYPNDGNKYFWWAVTSSWELVPQAPSINPKEYYINLISGTWQKYPQIPTDGKNYKLNHHTNTWEEKPSGE